jgi:aminotransferase
MAAVGQAVEAGYNQYSVTWGSPNLRAAIAAKYRRFGWPGLDPENEIVVTCGATEAMAGAFLALLEPGSEVIIFEPFYENYGPDCYLSGAKPRAVPLRPPDWTLDLEELTAAVGPDTRAIVLNTPHNPTGKVFSLQELTGIAELAVARDLLVFTDEIYEHIVYRGTHQSIALLPGMRDRVVTINTLGKTYAATGWRVGWAIAAPPLMGALRKVHDFLTVAAPAPLQEAAVVALGLPDSFYSELARSYRERRDLFIALAAAAGIGSLRQASGEADDVAFCRRMVIDGGVAAVPGSSFFSRPEAGRDLVRFAYPKRLETLRESGSRLEHFSQQLGRTDR